VRTGFSGGQDAGYRPDKVQRGLQPDDFKPMPTIGRGVEEIRIRADAGNSRVIYTARLADAVFVLYALLDANRGCATLWNHSAAHE
jgi:phage-related protein